MQPREQVKKNDVIQINEKFKGTGWIGCLMIVDEVKSWGVQAYLHVPMQGDAYLRIKHGEYDVIGKTAMVAKGDGEDG